MNFINIYKYDILNCIIKEGSIDPDTLAQITNYPLKKVNNTINQLIKDGWLNKDLTLTQKTYEEIKLKKPKNAIILSDGLGIGMLTTSMKVPKGTLHSLDLVRDKISNTYILPSDIWSEQNPFSKQELYSWYSVSDAVDDNSIVRIKPQRELILIEKDKGGNTMTGISYLLEEDANIVRENLRSFSSDKGYEDFSWEQTLFNKTRKMIVYPRVYKSEQVFKINDYNHLIQLGVKTNDLDTSIISLISKELNVDAGDIYDIFVLEMGKTNRSFKFTAKDKKYIMRIPGEGTDNLINRRNEYNVYKILKGRNVSDTVVYISPENGYKMSEFLGGARPCDPYNLNDVRLCMESLRAFHDYKLEVDHTFDIFGNIDHYEKLWGNQPSRFVDYSETKANIKSLKPIIDSLPKEWILSHADSVPGNFLLVEDDVFLIDWEYAGMQDPHLDIAMFALSAMYDRKHIDSLISSYFIEGYGKEIQLKIYCYIAIGGLLWSNWCEYKRFFGVDLGEYSLKQYAYAKEYYSIVKNEFLR